MKSWRNVATLSWRGEMNTSWRLAGFSGSSWILVFPRGGQYLIWAPWPHEPDAVLPRGIVPFLPEFVAAGVLIRNAVLPRRMLTIFTRVRHVGVGKPVESCWSSRDARETARGEAWMAHSGKQAQASDIYTSGGEVSWKAAVARAAISQLSSHLEPLRYPQEDGVTIIFPVFGFSFGNSSHSLA